MGSCASELLTSTFTPTFIQLSPPQGRCSDSGSADRRGRAFQKLAALGRMRKPSCKGYLSSAKSFYKHATYTRTTPHLPNVVLKEFHRKRPTCGFCLHGPQAHPQVEARAGEQRTCKQCMQRTFNTNLGTSIRGGMAGGSEGL